MIDDVSSYMINCGTIRNHGDVPMMLEKGEGGFVTKVSFHMVSLYIIHFCAKPHLSLSFFSVLKLLRYKSYTSIHIIIVIIGNIIAYQYY